MSTSTATATAKRKKAIKAANKANKKVTKKEQAKPAYDLTSVGDFVKALKPRTSYEDSDNIVSVERMPEKVNGKVIIAVTLGNRKNPIYIERQYVISALWSLGYPRSEIKNTLGIPYYNMVLIATQEPQPDSKAWTKTLKKDMETEQKEEKEEKEAAPKNKASKRATKRKTKSAS